VPFRFRRRVRIAKGLYVNVGKRGVTSVTIGRRGASMNVSKKGTRETYSLPGTGISYQTKRTPLAGCGGCGCVLPIPTVVVTASIGLVARRMRIVMNNRNPMRVQPQPHTIFSWNSWSIVVGEDRT